jgi:hypothetical protein
MMKIVIPLLVAVISACTSIASKHPVDQAPEPPKSRENCPVHGKSMNWGKLQSEDWTMQPAGFMEARRKRFPFNGCYYPSCCGGGIGEDRGFACPDCVRAAARWHPSK